MRLPMADRIREALSRIGDWTIEIRVARALGVVGDALAVLGPLVSSVAGFGAWSSESWARWVVLGGAAAGGVGWGAGRAFRALLHRRGTAVRIEHSDDIGAGLRAVVGHLMKPGDAGATRTHLLTRIAATAARTCPRPDAQIVAAFLVANGDSLHVREFSSYRRNRIPSASIPFDCADGAASAYRSGGPAYVADTRLAAQPDAFAGKTYRCILALPVMLGDRCVGVVSIDSTEPGHFDGRIEEIASHVDPFLGCLALLEWAAGGRGVAGRAKEDP